MWAFLGDGEMDEPGSLARSAWLHVWSWTHSPSGSTPTCSASAGWCEGRPAVHRRRHQRDRRDPSRGRSRDTPAARASKALHISDRRFLDVPGSSAVCSPIGRLSERKAMTTWPHSCSFPSPQCRQPSMNSTQQCAMGHTIRFVWTGKHTVRVTLAKVELGARDPRATVCRVPVDDGRRPHVRRLGD